MAKKNDNRLPYGLTIMTYGLIFLLSKVGILKHIPYGDRLLSIGSFFLIAGIIFLCAKTEKKSGIILTAIGLIINADLFFGWIHQLSALIVPILLITLGLVMVVTSKR